MLQTSRQMFTCRTQHITAHSTSQHTAKKTSEAAASPAQPRDCQTKRTAHVLFEGFPARTAPYISSFSPVQHSLSEGSVSRDSDAGGRSRDLEAAKLHALSQVAAVEVFTEQSEQQVLLLQQSPPPATQPSRTCLNTHMAPWPLTFFRNPTAAASCFRRVTAPATNPDGVDGSAACVTCANSAAASESANSPAAASDATTPRGSDDAALAVPSAPTLSASAARAPWRRLPRPPMRHQILAVRRSRRARARCCVPRPRASRARACPPPGRYVWARSYVGPVPVMRSGASISLRNVPKECSCSKNGHQARANDQHGPMQNLPKLYCILRMHMHHVSHCVTSYVQAMHVATPHALRRCIAAVAHCSVVSFQNTTASAARLPREPDVCWGGLLAFLPTPPKLVDLYVEHHLDLGDTDVGIRAD